MELGVPKELVAGERRVALIPETVGRLGDGVEVLVEAGAGEAAGFSDEAYRDAGATIGDPWGADVVAKVAAPTAEEAARLRDGQVLIAFLSPLTDAAGIERLAAGGVHAFALESVPRITRAQPMDALSSQATVAGYKAALIAADRMPRFFPMLMTAAGTIPPAKLLVLGAGVAGLQAIATARRLGAVVSAFDVRPAVREQVESLGATFLDLGIHGEETEGGYASELTAGAAGRPAGGAPGADPAVRRGDHDRRDPGPPRPEADHRRGRACDARGLGDRRPRRRDGRQLRADAAGRGDRRERRHDRRHHEPAVDDGRRTRASCSRATSRRCSG